MKIVTDYFLAKSLIQKKEPCFFAHVTKNLFEKKENNHQEIYIIGRQFKGLFDQLDGSYTAIPANDKTTSKSYR